MKNSEQPSAPVCCCIIGEIDSICYLNLKLNRLVRKLITENNVTQFIFDEFCSLAIPVAHVLLPLKNIFNLTLTSVIENNPNATAYSGIPGLTLMNKYLIDHSSYLIACPGIPMAALKYAKTTNVTIIPFKN